MFFSREDQARFMGMDSALRMNLSDALADKLDAEAISGTNGLLTSDEFEQQQRVGAHDLRVVSIGLVVLSC